MRRIEVSLLPPESHPPQPALLTTLQGDQWRAVCMARPTSRSSRAAEPVPEQRLSEQALSEPDRRHLSTIASPERRAEVLRGRRLIYQCAEHLTAKAAGEWRLDNPPGTAPVLVHPQAGRHHASLSHTGEWTAAVVADRVAVGIDLERRDRRVNRSGIARYLGWPASAADHFFEHWVLWEAAAKCRQTGVFQRHNPAYAALAPGWPAKRHQAGGYSAWLHDISADTLLCVVIDGDGPVEPDHER